MRAHQALVLNIYRLIDLVSLLPVLVVAHFIRHGDWGFGLPEQLVYFFSIGAWFISAKLTGYYNISFRAVSFFKKVKESLKVSFVFFGALLVAASFVKEASISRLMLLYYILLQAIFTFGTHHLVLKAIQARYHLSNKVRTLIYGAGDLGVQLAQEMLYHEELNRHFIGFVDDSITHKENMLVMGNRSSLGEICKEYQIEEIYLAIPPSATERIQDILTFGEEEGIRTHIGLDFNKWYHLPLELSYLGHEAILTVRKFPLDNPYNALVKRAFDVTLTSIGLILISPIMIGAAIAVKLSSPGPIFFKQKRTGYNQKDFECYKFRSMSVADRSVSDKQQATKNDARITPVGAFLRKSNIDELPQLLNVLKGDMSLIGPRPHMLSHTEEFKAEVSSYMIRHFVKPGISGWAQVNGWRGPTDTREKLVNRVEHDIFYCENWSLWFDIKIIFLTLFGKKVKNNAF